MTARQHDKLLILGAGPAGIGCAYTLAESGYAPRLIEKEREVGGLCRTLDYHGYLFDIGGHRFLTKSKEVNRLWSKVMGSDMLRVSRLSRIYYKKKFYNYPLSFFNTFWNFGLIEGLLCVASYFWCKLFKPGDELTFEGWITNHFGKRLYEIFFKTYTEKVWAVPCRDISANWAKQRIRGLSLKVAIQNAVMGMKGNRPKTLADNFLYPRKGPGEFYHRMQAVIEAKGGQFLFGHEAVKIHHQNDKIVSVEVEKCGNGRPEIAGLDYLFSSLPLPVLVQRLCPAPPAHVIAAAKKMHFRNFMIVNVILDKEQVFPDQWIYVHSPEVKLGRIQNYKNWSPSMVMDLRKTSLGLEYFCDVDDELWGMNDIDLIHRAISELEKIGIVSRSHLIDGFVVRQSDVYPVYSLDYQENIQVLKDYLKMFSNLQTMGRAGLFRYDNSDHALLTGIYAAKNYLGDGPLDLWQVNTDENYLEA
ncbi:MAG: NAD(P)/FAD-dependent oxidoreductase [Candidatus Omnitrophica bacterium]|nr:NAD(P)/FAD-dependent oxidoreductase [Candidatus Omnitrophota bacterium]MDD5671064.1 NAD(P)/FAD-dependent oxidoreductase [Candidatus Omnitrophota bacterium]